MIKPPLWRIARENAQLIGYRCKKCSFVTFPEPRKTCKRCRAPSDFEEVPIGPYGRVVSFVIQHRLPEAFQTPLPLAVIDLEGDARVYGHLADCKPEELKVGLQVIADFRVVFEDEGLGVYSYKFKPMRGAK